MRTIISHCKECKKELVTKSTWYNTMIMFNTHRIYGACHFIKEHKKKRVKLAFGILGQCILILLKMPLQILAWFLGLIAFLLEELSDLFYFFENSLYDIGDK